MLISLIFGDQTRNQCQPQAVADVELCLACVEGVSSGAQAQAVDHGISMALSGFIAFYNLLYIYTHIYIYSPSKPYINSIYIDIYTYMYIY